MALEAVASDRPHLVPVDIDPEAGPARRDRVAAGFDAEAITGEEAFGKVERAAGGKLSSGPKR